MLSRRRHPHALGLALAMSLSAQAAVTPFPDQAAPTAADRQRVIDLPGALNARDLGGLQGRAHAIPPDRFVRTANLAHLTPAGAATLQRDHVTLDIDLRSAKEAARAPDVLARNPAFAYRRISLLAAQSLDPAKLPHSLATLYVQALATDQSQFRAVFQLIAAEKHGAVLFHCTAGKDRTGMIAAMLLSLAGARQTTIAHDYALSAYYLKPMMNSPHIRAMVDKHPGIAPLLGAPPSAHSHLR